MSNRCDNCRFWSQMVAESYGCEPIKALCLSQGSRKGIMMPGRGTCEAWKSNHLGQVDDPPNYGEYVRAAYDAEEQETKMT